MSVASASDNFGPDIGRIRPIAEADEVTIPGPVNPAFLRAATPAQPITGPIRAIKIIRDHGLPGGGIMIGDRCCAVGEILAITGRPTDGEGRTIRVTDDMTPGLLLEDQALRYIKAGYAVPTSEAPTARIGHSLKKSPEIEKAIVPPAGQRAVARPQQQRAGAI